MGLERTRGLAMAAGGEGAAAAYIFAELREACTINRTGCCIDCRGLGGEMENVDNLEDRNGKRVLFVWWKWPSRSS